MPTYEYRCPDGHEFEHFVLKISLASGELPCPVCGKASMRQISAGGGFVFKGSGFYITDYGKDGKKDQRANPGAATGDKKDTAAKASQEGATGGNTPSKSPDGATSSSAATAPKTEPGPAKEGGASSTTKSTSGPKKAGGAD